MPSNHDSPLQSNRRQTVQQERASFAWQCVDAVPKGQRSDYASAIRRAPALIITNGLGPTLAFLLSKGKHESGAEADAHKPEGRIYLNLQAWLCDRDSSLLAAAVKNKDDHYRLVETLVHRSSAEYRHATAEVLSLLEWLKRFAEARSAEGQPPRAED